MLMMIGVKILKEQQILRKILLHNKAIKLKKLCKRGTQKGKDGYCGSETRREVILIKNIRRKS
jgi:hypothetical protein